MAIPVANEFSERYRELADGELIVLARQRQQLAGAASAALDFELAARGLGLETIREFEYQLEKKPEPEILAPADDLPPPCELPVDWFVDDPQDTACSVSSSRPKGVTVCALLFWLVGVVTAGWGASMFFEEPPLQSLAEGLLEVIVGIAQCVIGSGLWQLKAWARRSAEVFCWLCVVLICGDILGGAYMKLRGVAVDPMNPIWQFMGLFWQFLWARYLGSKSTREVFLAPEERLTT